jgi:hypothetical protein
MNGPSAGDIYSPISFSYGRQSIQSLSSSFSACWFYSSFYLWSPNGESNTTFWSFVNNSATNGICLSFIAAQHRLSSCNIHRSSQTSTEAAFVFSDSVVVTFSECSFKENVCPGTFFYASSGSIALSGCCFDINTTEGDVILESVSPFERTLAHLFLGQCVAQFHESKSSEVCGSPSDQSHRGIGGFHFRFSVLVLCLCDPIQTLIGIQFFIFPHRQSPSS